MPAKINLSAAEALLALIRTEFRNLPTRELLRQSPRALLGVDAAAETALKALEIKTVFDLATSLVFDAATKLLQAGTDHASAFSQHGSPTADLVREAAAAGKRIEELQFARIDVLESIPLAQVAAVEAALDVQTVRDLALYPPYQAALELLRTIYFPESAPGFDPERPADLLPKTGEYPTERVQYTTLLMGEIPTADGGGLTDLRGGAFKPLDLATLAAGDAGFKQVAFGALLTFNQSWYAQGVTLGQLLHSTTLAPGESTRIAVIDWSRKSRAGETEVISEVDDLTNDTTRNRSINEVTRAVATEAQQGFSQANSNSHSTASGTSAAGELSAPLGGLLGGPSGSMGSSSSEADTATHADSYSTSFGRRDIGSSMAQNINDRTHQHAHSSRSRRASVVKEVAQTEHEGVSTRVLANYNHMHALTVQYYEVVQIYRVEVAIKQADRVIFIPVALLDFNNESLVRRFRAVLSRAALSYVMREALANLDVLQIAPDKETHFTLLGDRLGLVLRDAVVNRGFLTAAARPTAEGAAPAAAVAPRSVARLFRTQPVYQQVNDKLWSADQTARLSGMLNRAVLRAGSNAIFLPTDVTVEGGAITGGAGLKIIFHDLHGTSTETVSAESPLALSEVKRIALSGSSAERDLEVVLTLTVNRNGVRFPLELPEVTVKKGATGETRVVEIKAGGINANLKQHLNENRMHYSQAVFRSLDSTQLALLLAPFGVSVAGKLVPVAQVVEPRPIRFIGNYLAFKMNTDTRTDGEFAKWLDEHGIVPGSAKEDIIPLPSGGTFAEAVLGRSNCAEKLDLTRFWNWQDSPIPLQPTEIAAIQTGSRATPEDTKAGSLSNPIINITTPGNLPDPTGTAAILAAIQNGNMFRDMSGLQGTIGLAQAALQATSAGAATAGEQAGTNMNNLLKANSERQRIAAEMITSLARTAASAYTGGMVSPGGGISAGSSHSQDGAKINYFDKTRESGPAGNGSTGGGVTPASAGRSGAGSSSAPGGAGVDGGMGRDSGASYSRNPAALAATWHDAEPPANLIQRAMDYGFQDAPGSSLSSGLGATALANLTQNEYQRRRQTDLGAIHRFTPAAASTLVLWAQEVTPPAGLTVRNWTHAGVKKYVKDSAGQQLGPVRRPDNLWQVILHETAGFANIGAGAPWSVHFTIGPDAVVYQHCDVALFCEHGNQMNPFSVGIEFTNHSAFNVAQAPRPAIVPPGTSAPITDLQGGSVGGTTADDRPRLPITWLSGIPGDGVKGDYYVMPPLEQVAALARLVRWLTGGVVEGAAIDAPPTWRQLMANPADSAKKFFAMTFHPDFQTAVGMGGVMPHILFQHQHFDGSVLGLYTWLVIARGLNEATAYTRLMELVSDPKFHVKFSVPAGGTPLVVHGLDVTALADTTI